MNKTRICLKISKFKCRIFLGKTVQLNWLQHSNNVLDCFFISTRNFEHAVLEKLFSVCNRFMKTNVTAFWSCYPLRCQIFNRQWISPKPNTVKIDFSSSILSTRSKPGLKSTIMRELLIYTIRNDNSPHWTRSDEAKSIIAGKPWEEI